MAYLLKGVRQADLVNLAEELQLPASSNMKLTELRNLILNSENYEEELTRDILTIIVETRIEGEGTNSLSNQALYRNVAGQSNPYKYQPDIQKLIPKFNSGESDISLCLVIFELYMKRFNINQSDWVSHLMGYLPADIVQVLAREPEEQAENYEHIKKLLLKRFKLSPDVFRQKFAHHQKKAEGTLRDFLFEARNYLEEWLKRMEKQGKNERKIFHQHCSRYGRSPTEALGSLPPELVFGKNHRIPETLLYEKWFEPGEDESPVTEYVFQLINRLKRCQEVAVKQMEELQIKRKKWYDKNAVKREFKEGDLVLVLATGRGNKFGIQ
ncbi:hypothetical protein AVEN_266529-1 [Araneus ventricosus]|uniref:Uncharacterized protein n=1 Tax=Araneus ventricosus TaxID=182803 RepID=A0A4Y2MTT1_ARAVE|nr:hypothetical protein AVEN_266529-1 [Araneus ventricosus]